MLNIIKRKTIFLTFSGLLVAASIVLLVLFGLRLGIDFTGGTLLEIEFNKKTPSPQEVKEDLKSLNLDDIVVQPSGEKDILIRLKHIDNDTHQDILSSLKKKFGKIEEKRYETIGPTISNELKTKSVYAIIVVLICIILYLAFAFRKVSGYVSSWKYGVCAVIALIHDVTIPMGIFALLGKFFNVEIDSLFVTALLTILGFSVHDTIVVFDRIRYNQLRSSDEDFEDLVNRSVNETITRSINTSLTVFFVLFALYLFGGETIKYFVLTLMIGIIFGTYSSIFIASPLLVIWQKLNKSKIK